MTVKELLEKNRREYGSLIAAHEFYRMQGEVRTARKEALEWVRDVVLPIEGSVEFKRAMITNRIKHPDGRVSTTTDEEK